ncbi:MAG: CoA pyrophosphatase [Acidobacteria bacterium]|nr:CoA pyrophosphatase [Acidobacteriota bacterium]
MAEGTTWLDQVREKLDRPWPERDPILTEGSGAASVRDAAVLVPLYVRDKELFTLFTKRTEKVKKHKGQISFPGGGKEPSDENLWVTATRETEEEIGVPRDAVKILGALPPLVTVTDFRISPFVGAIPYPVEWKPDEVEVEKILEIPISYLVNPLATEEQEITWKGRPVRTKVYHYHGHAIWGATAHILSDLLEVLQGS